jgi:hypothetical protein
MIMNVMRYNLSCFTCLSPIVNDVVFAVFANSKLIAVEFISNDVPRWTLVARLTWIVDNPDFGFIQGFVPPMQR